MTRRSESDAIGTRMRARPANSHTHEPDIKWVGKANSPGI